MDLIIRATIVYFFLLILLRATGKRELGQLSPIDFVVLLIISEALQAALTDGDRSLVGGFILATTLSFWHIVMSVLTYRSQKLREVVNGVSVALVEEGKLNEEAMRAEHVPEDDIISEARAAGVETISEIKKAVLETSGKITIIPKEKVFEHVNPKAEKNLPD